MKRKAFLILALCISAALLSAPWTRRHGPRLVMASGQTAGNHHFLGGRRKQRPDRARDAADHAGRQAGSRARDGHEQARRQPDHRPHLPQHARRRPNYLLLANPTLVGNHIAGLTPINYIDVTPIALLLSEHTVFSVRTDAPFKNMRELFDKLGQSDGAQHRHRRLGGPNHLALAQAAKVSGVDPKN